MKKVARSRSATVSIICLQLWFSTNVENVITSTRSYECTKTKRNTHTDMVRTFRLLSSDGEQLESIMNNVNRGVPTTYSASTQNSFAVQYLAGSSTQKSGLRPHPSGRLWCARGKNILVTYVASFGTLTVAFYDDYLTLSILNV